jgi:hypothetical protein
MRPKRLVCPARTERSARTITWSADVAGARKISRTSPGPFLVIDHDSVASTSTGSRGSSSAAPSHKILNSPSSSASWVNDRP